MGAHSTDLRAFLFSNPMGDAPSLAQSELAGVFLDFDPQAQKCFHSRLSNICSLWL